MKFNFLDEEPDPYFDPLPKLPRFETFDQARNSRKQLLNSLTDYGGDAAEQLSSILGACKRGTRCRSAACPVCLRKFRRVWASRIASCIESEHSFWCAVSIVPSDLAFPLGELDRFQHKEVKERLRKQLERSHIKGAAVIGGFDYALQAFEGRAPKWRPHLYLLIMAQPGRIEGALKRHYPRDADTRKPMTVKPLQDGRENAMKVATYTFKAEFYRRAPSDDRRGNRDTEHLPLEPAHRAALSLFLHNQGFFGRVIRRGKHRALPELRTR